MLGIALLIAWAALSGRFLVVDHPEKSDVIVVLAGETERRPSRGIELLHQGYAQSLLLDVPAQAKIFGRDELEIANAYLQNLPEAIAARTCPIFGLSTQAEAHDVMRCLGNMGIHRVLIVTSDYHTRRALDIFRKEGPEYQYSIAASFDPVEFGTSWWRHREWAKVYFDEWMKLIWWEAVDRWR